MPVAPAPLNRPCVPSHHPDVCPGCWLPYPAAMGRPAQEQRARLARPLARLLPPVTAWLAANLISWSVAAASDVSWWSIAGRRRWDSEHYLSIAKTGYEMFRCRDRYANFPDVVCGNVAWFPAYPMAVRAVSALGLSPEVAAVVVSEVALLAMFGVLWWLLGGRLTAASGLTLAVGAVFPGGIYFHAIFPLSLLALALLVALVGVRTERWWLAAIAGFVAVGSHLVGVTMVGMLVLSPLFAWRSSQWPGRIARGLGAATVAASALLWVHWLMWRATGHWDAYETINRVSYGQGGWRNPVTELHRAYDFPFRELYQPNSSSWLVRHSLTAHHTELWLNVALFAAVIAAAAYAALRERGLDPEEWAALLLTGAIALMPFVAGAVNSWYRNHAAAFVVLVLLARLPRWLQAVVLLACAAQYALLASMFFSGILV